MYEAEKAAVLNTALEIKKCGLVSLSGGNVGLRADAGRFLVTPSGMIYEEMTPEDVCLIDEECHVMEGRRKPSSDSEALTYIFRHMPEVGAVIHTHQPWATPSSAVGMGVLAVEYAGGSRAVILKHHGVITFGADLKEALYAAVYLEEGAKTLMLARMANAVVPPLDPELIAREKAGWETYGQ